MACYSYYHASHVDSTTKLKKLRPGIPGELQGHHCAEAITLCSGRPGLERRSLHPYPPSYGGSTSRRKHSHPPNLARGNDEAVREIAYKNYKINANVTKKAKKPSKNGKRIIFPCSFREPELRVLDNNCQSAVAPPIFTGISLHVCQEWPPSP